LEWRDQARPLEIGLTTPFATGHRRPRALCLCREPPVFGLDPKDPIQVSYGQPIGDEPTGKNHPELLKMGLTLGHDGTIIDGISRIGFMTGGHAARWKDGEKADVLTAKPLTSSGGAPMVPSFSISPRTIRMCAGARARFVGKSGCGVRGDVIVEFDWCVGKILSTLDQLNWRPTPS